MQAFEFLFQLFNYKNALAGILDGFDKAKAGASKKVSSIVRKALRSISSRGQSGTGGSHTKGKRNDGGRSLTPLDTIQEHNTALRLRGYEVVGAIKGVWSHCPPSDEPGVDRALFLAS